MIMATMLKAAPCTVLVTEHNASKSKLLAREIRDRYESFRFLI